MIGELEVGGHDQKTLRVGETFELDANGLAHRTPGAISANQVVAAESLDLVAGFDLHFDMGVVLRHGLHVGAEQDFRVRQFGQPVEQQLVELPLLALQAKRVAGLAFQQGHVEFRDQAFLAIALLRVAGNQALRHQLVGEPEACQHVERGRVKGRSAEVFGCGGVALENRHCDAGGGQRECADQAHGTGAGNQYMRGHVICFSK